MQQNRTVRDAIRKLTALRNDRGWTTAQIGDALGVDEWGMAQFQRSLHWFEDIAEVAIVPRGWWRGQTRRQHGGLAAVGRLPGTTTAQQEEHLKTVVRDIITVCREARIQRGLSLREIAVAVPDVEQQDLDVVEAELGWIENEAADVTVSVLRVYADALGCELKIAVRQRDRAVPTA